MKKLQILALVMLFACFGASFVQAKVACIKGFEWRHGKCRKKVKAKATNSDSTTNDTSNTAPIAPITLPTQPIMGGSSTTYAPQTFQPVPAFSGGGLVGNYFSSSQTATIHDPSGVNPISYSFSNIQPVSGNIIPNGLTLIGTFPTPGFVRSNIYCSGCPNGTTVLYGNLTPQIQAQ